MYWRKLDMLHITGQTVRSIALILANLVAIGSGIAAPLDGPPGIVRPIVLPPFDPGAAVCNPPSGLQHILGFAQDNQRKFMQGVARGLALAAEDRGLMFEIAQADNDAAKMRRTRSAPAGVEQWRVCQKYRLRSPPRAFF
jgi:ribose transport system substrate-binding protein